jgi:nicotinate-nucleotide pyrophosphorylase (carboxylating)
MNLEKLVTEALKEDIPDGDITTDSFQLQNRMGRARLIAKEDLVISGREVFEQVYRQLDPASQLDWQFTDGQMVLRGQTVTVVVGRLDSILKAERVGLNFLGHLSGIATLTRCFVDQVRHTKTKILDTRKTTPGLRELEKKAVRDGGGTNHRLNLSDGILIKENHIRWAGGLAAAVKAVRAHSKKPVEVETRSVEEVIEAVASQVDQILLDNMSNDIIRDALKYVPASIKTEASGNMSIDRVRSVAELGVDFISVGALTHSAPCADLSLLVE